MRARLLNSLIGVLWGGGVLVLCVGVGMIYAPAGWVVLGLLLLASAFVLMGED